jgi:hypothetical protein
MRYNHQAKIISLIIAQSSRLRLDCGPFLSFPPAPVVVCSALDDIGAELDDGSGGVEDEPLPDLGEDDADDDDESLDTENQILSRKQDLLAHYIPPTFMKEPFRSKEFSG